MNIRVYIGTMCTYFPSKNKEEKVRMEGKEIRGIICTILPLPSWRRFIFSTGRPRGGSGSGLGSRFGTRFGFGLGLFGGRRRLGAGALAAVFPLAVPGARPGSAAGLVVARRFIARRLAA